MEGSKCARTGVRFARISATPFLLWHFSPGDKIEHCSAQFLAVCWIVRVEFKVQRPRDGLSVSNALLLDQSLPAFIGHHPIRLETERFSKDAICSSLFRRRLALSATERQRNGGEWFFPRKKSSAYGSRTRAPALRGLCPNH